VAGDADQQHIGSGEPLRQLTAAGTQDHERARERAAVDAGEDRVGAQRTLLSGGIAGGERRGLEGGVVLG